MEQEQRSVHYEDQSAHLKRDRESNAALAATNVSSCQATLRRLKRAFENFFRRVKHGETPAYPCFKGPDQLVPQHGYGCTLTGSRVYFQHIGTVHVLLHRLIEGTVKTLSFSHHAGDWSLSASCDLPGSGPKPHPGPAVGIDLGLLHFATLSTGKQAINPPYDQS